MYRIIPKEFTVAEIVNNFVMGLNKGFAGSASRDYFKDIKKTNPLLITSKSADPYITENIFKHTGKVLEHINLSIDTLFNNQRKQNYKSRPATFSDKNTLDFLGFYSKPKIVSEETSSRLKDNIFKIIEDLNKIEMIFKYSLSDTAIETYLGNMEEFTIPKSLTLVTEKNPINYLKILINKGYVKRNNFLTAVLGIDDFNGQIPKITKTFNNSDIISQIELNIVPYLDNETDIRKDASFFSDSTQNFYTWFTNEYNRIVQMGMFPIGITGINNYFTGMESFEKYYADYGKYLFIVKYLKFYLSIGYDKLFDSKIVFDTNNVSVKTKEQTIESPEPLVDKIKVPENARELQNKSYRAYEILTKGSISNTIPAEYNDGKIGPRSKKSMKDLKSLIVNNSELRDNIKGSPTSNFGDYELSAIEYILKNPDNFDGLKSHQSIAQDKKEESFLGIEGLEISKDMQEYILKDFFNLSSDDLAFKVNDLLQIKLKRKPTDAELSSAISKIKILKDNHQNTISGMS